MRIGQAFALNAKNRAALRSFRHFQTLLSVQSRNLQLGAEGSLRNAQRNRAIKIRATAFEKTVLLHIQNNIQITRGAAVGTGFAFTLHAKPRALVDARRNAQLDGALAIDATLTAAIRATLFLDLTRALAGRAGEIDGEKSLLVNELTTA